MERMFSMQELEDVLQHTTTVRESREMEEVAKPDERGREPASDLEDDQDDLKVVQRTTPGLKRKVSARIKSFPRKFLERTPSKKSKGQPRGEEEEPPVEVKNQKKGKKGSFKRFQHSKSVVDADDDELKSKLKKWMHSANTGSPVVSGNSTLIEIKTAILKDKYLFFQA